MTLEDYALKELELLTEQKQQIKPSKYPTNTLYLPREKIWVNPNYFELMTEDKINNEIPKETNKKEFKAIYGEISKISKQDPIKNTNWDFIRFKDCTIFKPAIIEFNKSKKARAGTKLPPSYTSYIAGTIQHKEFWKEEYKRCIEGYEPIVDGYPCGIRIPGEFYFYLNYCMLSKVGINSSGETIDIFIDPDFLAMDYYYFKEIESREFPERYGFPLSHKKSIAVAKSRRKGFSFKASAGAVWKTHFIDHRTSKPKVIIASETADDAMLCFEKSIGIIDFLSKYTPFGRNNNLGNPSKNGGWKQIPVTLSKDEGHYICGIENTKTRARDGRLSEIQTVSLYKADKLSGEGIQRVYIEEAGKVSNLEKAWTFGRESLKVGSFQRGIAIIFGTGGEMISASGNVGSSAAFSNMFNNPIAKSLAAFDNIHEYDNRNTQCGWFVCDMWYNPSLETIDINGIKYRALDENGNPYFWVAELLLNVEALNIKSKDTKDKYEEFITQRCKTPSEAFFVPFNSVFPTADIQLRKTDIQNLDNSYDTFRTPGRLVERHGEVLFEPILDNSVKPITSNSSLTNREGCILKYESPKTLHGKIPDDAYIISVDPVGNNTSGDSYNAIVVLKTPKYSTIFGQEDIVMTYVGRSAINPLNHLYDLLEKMSKYYNARITFENDRDGGIQQHFFNKGMIDRLLSKPALILDKHLKNSATNLREFGHSMGTARHKDIGEMYLNQWLLKRSPDRKVYDINNKEQIIKGIRNLDLLKDELLIDQLLQYNRQGNYDIAMALMGGVIQLYNMFPLEIDYSEDESSDVYDYIASYFFNNVASPQEKAEWIKKQRMRVNK